LLEADLSRSFQSDDVPALSAAFAVSLACIFPSLQRGSADPTSLRRQSCNEVVVPEEENLLIASKWNVRPAFPPSSAASPLDDSSLSSPRRPVSRISSFACTETSLSTTTFSTGPSPRTFSTSRTRSTLVPSFLEARTSSWTGEERLTVTVKRSMTPGSQTTHSDLLTSLSCVFSLELLFLVRLACLTYSAPQVYEADGLRLNDIHFRQSPRWTTFIHSSKNVHFSHLSMIS
jgi:hypothetical protein